MTTYGSTWVLTCSDPVRVAERLARNTVPGGNGCWIWTGRLDTSGYGKFTMDGRQTGSHRAAWLAYRGDIPAGLMTDHLCRVRVCCNPWHMELVSGLVNTRRGRPGRRRVGGCSLHGHSDGRWSTYGDGYTRWRCTICQREYQRQRRANGG